MVAAVQKFPGGERVGVIRISTFTGRTQVPILRGRPGVPYPLILNAVHQITHFLCYREFLHLNPENSEGRLGLSDSLFNGDASCALHKHSTHNMRHGV